MLLNRLILSTGFFAKLLLIASLGLIYFDLSLSEVSAQSIRVVDCQGKTRAFRQHTTPTDTSIRVDVINSLGQPVTNAEISLFNAEGQIVKAAVIDGIAEFTQITPGVWMISSENQGLFFTQIALSDFVAVPFWQSATGTTLVKAAEIALFVGAVAGAVIAIDEASDGGSGGGNNDLSPPPETCMTCNPDLAAPSIPDFE